MNLAIHLAKQFGQHNCEMLKSKQHWSEMYKWNNDTTNDTSCSHQVTEKIIGQWGLLGTPSNLTDQNEDGLLHPVIWQLEQRKWHWMEKPISGFLDAKSSPRKSVQAQQQSQICQWMLCWGVCPKNIRRPRWTSSREILFCSKICLWSTDWLLFSSLCCSSILLSLASFHWYQLYFFLHLSAPYYSLLS